MSGSQGFAPLALGWFGDHQAPLQLDAIHLALDLGVRARWEEGQGQETLGTVDRSLPERLWQACQEVVGPAARTWMQGHRLQVQLELPDPAGLSWSTSWVVAVLRALDHAGVLQAAGLEGLATRILDHAGMTAPWAALHPVLDGGVTHSVCQPARFRLPLEPLPGHLVLIGTHEPLANPVPPHLEGVRTLVAQLTERLAGFSIQTAPLEELYDGLLQLGVPAPPGFWEEIHQRDLTQAGRTVWEARPLDGPRLGELVDEAWLRREELGPSSPPVRNLRAALLERGALCMRWAGPQRGGTLVAWTLEDPGPLAMTARDLGHEAWVTRVRAPGPSARS